MIQLGKDLFITPFPPTPPPPPPFHPVSISLNQRYVLLYFYAIRPIIHVEIIVFIRNYFQLMERLLNENEYSTPPSENVQYPKSSTSSEEETIIISVKEVTHFSLVGSVISKVKLFSIIQCSIINPTSFYR